LSINALTLEAGSVTEVALSRPSETALFDVAGDLTLGGTLNVTGLPGYGAGVYRLFNYGGAFTNNGMALSRAGGASADGLSLQTATIGQVNLVDRANATLAFWDGDALANRENGLIEGGAGTWNLTNSNWTDADGAMNGAMAPAPGFAVFQGAGGVVTIDNGAGRVGATGLQFASNGYALKGGALELSGAQATIRVGDGSAAGANTSATIAASLTGGATLVKADLGTLFLTGTNSYTGGTVVQAGILVGDAGSIRGDIRNDGVVVFNQTSNATFTGAISGAGAMVKTGAGALTLGGSSGNDWRIVDGSLISTSALFTGDVDIDQGARLIFDQAADGTYAGTLTGTGAVIVRGGGIVRFTGDGSRFLGGATVGGAGNNLLSVNGVLGGIIEVLAGARLQGNGTIGGGRIAGTIAPGNSIGTLTVNGDLSILSGGVFEVEADAAGQSDKVVVTGSATIESGATLSVLAANGNYAPNTRYSVLTAAGGVIGTFSNVTSNLAFLTPTLSYGAGAVTLDLKRNTIDFDAVAQTRNQRAVAPAVEALGLGNAVYDATITLTAPEARAAFDQLAGSDHASLRASLLDDSRFMRDAILSRGDIAGEEGSTGWGRVLGAQRKVDSDVEAQGYKRDLDGFVTGLDGALNDHWRGGVAFGYMDSELRTGQATHKADSYELGGGVLGDYGRVTVQVGGVYAWHAIASQRRVTFGGLDQRLGDKDEARSFQGFGEVAVRTRAGPVELQPFAGLAHVALFDADVNEAGGAAALHGGEGGSDATYGTLGVKARIGWDLGGSRLSLDGATAVRRTFDAQAPSLDLAFANGAAFKVGGLPLDRTEATLDLGLKLDLNARVQLAVSYGGVYSDHSTDQGGRAELRWRF
jgi:autotransporter-associated beta strand protein